MFTRRNRLPNRRRGVLLLVVLAVIVLFALIAVTFIAVSGQYRRGAVEAQKRELVNDDGDKLIEIALLQLVRGTNDIHSRVAYHDILRDIYGTFTKGEVSQVAAVPANSADLVQIHWQGGTDQEIPDYYSGCVFTAISGDVKGRSTRIVRSVRASGEWVLFVDAFPGSPGLPTLPKIGDKFIVNGRAFNGTGFGYDETSKQLDGTHNGILIALSPNFGAYGWDKTVDSHGANEPYDAPDEQNMFLAYVPAGATSSSQIIPSFHRPDLIGYWAASGATSADDLRRAILRPMHFDHPLFTGSNPAVIPNVAPFDPMSGPWDVDNDRDGIPDSVWIDIGLPAKVSRDGRRYKPLVAVLCLDLDSRLDLNAHGNAAQLLSEYLDPITSPGNVAGIANGEQISPPRGRGYGPAEINPAPILGTGSEAIALLLGRYGPDGGVSIARPGAPNSEELLSALKTWNQPSLFFDSGNLNVAINSRYRGPPDVWGRGALVLDLAGQPITASMGTNVVSGGTIGTERLDDPYEMDFSPLAGEQGNSLGTARDMPYTVADLETLLRFADEAYVNLSGKVRGARTPSRLLDVAPTLFADPSNPADAARRRKLVTTASRHVPAPAGVLPIDFRNSAQGLSAPRLAQLIRARLGGMTDAQKAEQLQIMLPWELRKGTPMDVNRWFGNGEDDNNNGVVDDPGEAFNAESLWGGTPLETNFNPVNDDPIIAAPDGTASRQIFARHLYCMAMALAENDFEYPLVQDPTLDSTKKKRLRARRIAQWAINVVDFRDPDNICTPFEYDVFPFNDNGWSVDGNLATPEEDRDIVWGVEYPDVLLTEAIAFHDKRLKDTDQDTTGKKRVKDNNGTKEIDSMGDDDLDQYRVPQGSVFFELYCTRNRQLNIPDYSTDLYTFANDTWSLDLGRMPQNSLNPVWRIAITPKPEDDAHSFRSRAQARPDTTTFELGNMDLFPEAGMPNTIAPERVVWFTPQQPDNAHPEKDIIFYNRNFGGAVPLPPGQYCVVGPRAKTYLGSVTDDSTPGKGSTQRIELSTTAVITYDQAGTKDTGKTVGTDIKPRFGIVCAAKPPSAWTNAATTAPQGVGISVSEPLPQGNYYAEPTYKLPDADGTDSWDDGTLPDAPFDYQAGRPLEEDDSKGTGTYLNYKTAVLQRLANPLLPWNPMPNETGYNANLPINPYVTIDWIPIDLTVFNGEDRAPGGLEDEFDMEDPEPYTSDETEKFRTRERSTNSLNVWAQTTTDPADTPEGGGMDNHFRIDLVHTLGYLNAGYGAPLTTPPAYIGDPPSPFPWLAIYNRPYASELELMMVPASSQGRLLHEFRSYSGADPYDPTTGMDEVDKALGHRAPYGHLLNFFHATRPGETQNSNKGQDLVRIFDYLETPSPFVGTEKWLRPSAFGDLNDTTIPYLLRPPHNKFSLFRDPGRININTISDPLVWRAIATGFPAMDSDLFWAKIEASRAGNDTFKNAGDTYPSRFANPFRPAAAADLVPLPGMERPGVEATLLRSDPANSARPLFRFEATEQYQDYQRNPNFYYQGLSRLSNLLTTRSNVFAVWITVGYFEVRPKAIGFPTGANTDGYELTQEIGLDTGEVTRHRGFFIIDRSIPVAFEPGENHNVDQAILVRRFLE
jgi:hypothetical protein